MKTNPERLALLVIASVGVLLAVLLVAPPATASENPTQVRIDNLLAKLPGGVQTGSDQVSWDHGTVVLTIATPDNAKSIGSCATGDYCAWSGTSYTGTRLTFTACSASGTSSSVAALSGLVRSTANARSSGTVQDRNGSTVVHTMAANTGIPVNASTLTALVCFT